MHNKRRSTLASVAVLSSLAFFATACGSSTQEDATASVKTDTPGQKAALAYLNEHVDNPTSIALDIPLDQSPATGKSVIYLKFPTGVSQRSDRAHKDAADVLGWKYSSVDSGATPASAVSAFEAALAKKPDAIIFGGYPAAIFTQQIQKAKAAGVTVLSNATGDGPVDGVLADLSGTAQAELFAKLAAAYFVSHTEEDSKVAAFTFQGFPISEDFTNGFVSAVKKWCATCGTEVVNQQLTDVATKTPANVVTYLQRNPSVKWLVFASGDLSQGVAAAIKAAGIKGVHILGQVPTETNFAGLKSGAETGWVGFPVDVLAWRMIDLLARQFEGLEIKEAAAAPLPLQMITSDNVDTVVSEDGYYVGVEDYQDQFKKLWNVN